MEIYECPRCQGAGQFPANDGYNGCYMKECGLCEGTGEIDVHTFYSEVQSSMRKMLRKPEFEKLTDKEILSLFEEVLRERD